MSRATWLRMAANCHIKLGNRLLNLARTMKPSNNAAAEIVRQFATGKTLAAYKELATKCSKQSTLTDLQKSTIKASWKGQREMNSKKAIASNKPRQEDWDNIYDEIQQFGKEAQELLELTEQCDLNNGIHSAKLTRCGEAHKRFAQRYFAKAKWGSRKSCQEQEL